jgi:Bacteriophage tail sheath protein
LVVDPKNSWSNVSVVTNASTGVSSMGLNGDMARNGAIYFPRIKQADSQLGGQIETFVPCGAVAGVMARTDSQHGVWKAPAGIDASLAGVAGLQVEMTDAENGLLNPLGVNCLRTFPAYGRVVWGARTLRGADAAADEYKYVPVRRLALFIEESLYRGTQWVVFEPNDESMWAQVRLNVGAFMNNLFRQGAFQGATPRDAYFVKCDKETTTQNDINLGIVNIIVGFAPLKPAEFVIIKLQQMAGQIAA